MNNKIDLHMHTNKSDGVLSPQELIDLSIKKGIRIIAITDHDAIDAIPEAMKYAKDKNIEVIPGIEISCDELEKGFKELHVIGLFIDYNNKEILEITENIKKQRIAQKKEMIKKLQNLGYKITFEEVAKSVKGSFGRPHIARVLLEKYPEQFSSIKEIFDKLLGMGKPAYIERERMRGIKDAIKLIKNAGGLSFLAHPGVYKKEDSLELIKFFKSLGGDGIETYYPYYIICPDLKINKTENEDLINFYKQIAKKEGFLESGGNDFHGGDRETLGEVSLPEILLNKLKEGYLKKLNTLQQKVFVFGIDGAPPELIFDKWKNDLPNLNRLMQKGSYTKLTSTIPPSTIVAWNSMLSGKDTSEIGIFSYNKIDEKGNSRLVDSRDIQCKVMWNILNEQNKRGIFLYVPLTYPVNPINGCMVSDFLTPGINSNCTFPENLKDKIKSLGNPELFFDVELGLAGHKGLDIDSLLKRTYEMTNMQISLLKDLVTNEKWDFFMSVMIGTDRLQHMLWKHFDETHRDFIKDSPYKNALKDYYIFLDNKLGEILNLLDKNTIVIIVSDHGMVKQEGKININNWLIQEGYLFLKGGISLQEKKRFDINFVDMGKSLAYGGGAYNARVYINKLKVGKNYFKLRDELAKKIKNIPDNKGNKLDTKVYFAEDIYKNPSLSECPDLTVYFDDLRWASNPDLGQEGLYSWKTAIGADSAGHSRQGCFIICGPTIPNKGEIDEINIQQVAPTIINLLGLKIPKDITVKGIDLN